MAIFSLWSDRPRPVEDPRALRLGAFQQPGGGDIFEIEGRILAHQHRIEGGERLMLAFLLGTPRAVIGVSGLVGVELQARRRGAHRAIAPGQRLAHDGMHLVATPLRLAHHGDAGVLVGFQRFQRIEYERQSH